MPTRIDYDPQPKLGPSAGTPIQVHLRRPPRDGVIRWHRHPWGQLACLRRGNMRVSAAGAMWVVPIHRAIWIPAGVEHENVMLGEVEFDVLYVDPRVSPLSAASCCVVEVSTLMRELTRALADDAIASRRRALRARLLLEEIRAARRLPLGLPLPRDRRLRALCDAVMAEPGSPATLKEWARRAGASERTLARLFRAELQIGFGAWRRQLRLTRAIDLIGRGWPLADVAAELGYANLPAFSSMFRQALGYPPSRLGDPDPL